jgi:predicted permease
VLLCSALGNTSFLGFPLCSALLGRGALPLAAVYDQLGSFLMLCTVTPLVIARAAGSSPPSPRQMLLRIASFPPFVALLLALLPVAHPAWLDPLLDALAAALIPTALFAVGLRLRLTPPHQRAAFAFALTLKLLVLPLAALLLGRALGAARDVLAVAVLESAMPAMITAGAVLMAAGVASELAASLVGWGILLAQLSVPAWALVVNALTR